MAKNKTRKLPRGKRFLSAEELEMVLGDYYDSASWSYPNEPTLRQTFIDICRQRLLGAIIFDENNHLDWYANFELAIREGLPTVTLSDGRKLHGLPLKMIDTLRGILNLEACLMLAERIYEIAVSAGIVINTDNYMSLLDEVSACLRIPFSYPEEAKQLLPDYLNITSERRSRFANLPFLEMVVRVAFCGSDLTKNNLAIRVLDTFAACVVMINLGLHQKEILALSAQGGFEVCVNLAEALLNKAISPEEARELLRI